MAAANRPRATPALGRWSWATYVGLPALILLMWLVHRQGVGEALSLVSMTADTRQQELAGLNSTLLAFEKHLRDDSERWDKYMEAAVKELQAIRGSMEELGAIRGAMEELKAMRGSVEQLQAAVTASYKSTADLQPQLAASRAEQPVQVPVQEAAAAAHNSSSLAAATQASQAKGQQQQQRQQQQQQQQRQRQAGGHRQAGGQSRGPPGAKGNLVAVTSVIHTINAAVSDSPGPRSVFTAEERYQQTLQTVASVQAAIPDADIFIIEGSVLQGQERAGLESKGCTVLDATSLSDVINSPYKSYAEVKLMLFLLDALGVERIKQKYRTFSKISGRYQLTNNFSWMRFPLDRPVYLRDGRDWYDTRYYRLPTDMLQLYHKRLLEAEQDGELSKGGVIIEHFNLFAHLPMGYELDMQEQELIGVKGSLGPYNYTVEVRR